MPTLYVENVPEDLYAALRKRAKASRTSIASEVVTLLMREIPTTSELKRRRDSLNRIVALQQRVPRSAGPFPSTEEMLREDRER